MTKIKLFKSNGYYTGFECSGHTGYGKNGEDILCATISGIAQSIVLGLKEVCGIDINIERKDSSGYLKVELLEQILDGESIIKTQVLFETFECSIKDLIEGYSKYISMEVIGNVY
jgi:uncharacterized protein YsxB (DUF464 family)